MVEVNREVQDELEGEFVSDDEYIETEPTIEYIDALRTELEDFYRADDQQIDEMRAMRSRTFDVPIPTEAMYAPGLVYRDPTIEDEAQRVPAMFFVNDPTITITPISETDANQEMATRNEKFFKNAMWESGSREIGPPTHERVVDAMCNDGGACSKLIFDNSRWRNRWRIKVTDFTDDPFDWQTGKSGKSAARKYDEATEVAKRGAGVPLDWISVDIRSVYPVIHNREVAEVLEIQRRPLNQTFQRYRLGYAKDGKIVPQEIAGPDWRKNTRGKDVTLAIHWTKKYVTEAVLDGQGGRRILRQWEHGYNKPPYVFTTALTKGYERNRKIGMSISETKKALVLHLSFLRTLNAQISLRDAMPPIFEEVDAEASPVVGNDGKARTNETYELGMKYTLPPGSKIRTLDFQQNMQGIQSEIGQVKQDIEKMEPPRPAGEIGNLQGAGFAISSILTEGKVRFAPIGSAIEHHFEEITKLLADIVVHKIGEPVHVEVGAGGKQGWISAGPRELAKPFKVTWKLNPEAPSAKIVEGRYWDSRVAGQTASLDMAVEAQGGNPDEVRFGRALDRIRMSPAYQAQEEAAVWAEIGRGDRAQLQQYAEGIAQLKQAAQTGTPPAEAPPAEPGVSGGTGQGMAGNSGVPDFASLASSPNGTGAAPVGGGPGPGMFMGTPTTPTAAATANVQSLGT